MSLEAIKVNRIGPFAVDEIPQALQITFKDSNDVVIDLTGYTAEFQIIAVDQVISGLGAGTPTVESPETNGVTQYVWAAADFTTAGLYRAQMWVGNGTNRLVSEVFEWFVEEVTMKGTVP